MKRIICLAAAAALVAGLPLSATAGGSRSETGEYNDPQFNPTGTGGSIYFSNGVSFQPKRGERSAIIEIADDYSESVGATISQDVDGDGRPDSEVNICNRTKRPIAIDPSVKVIVSVHEGSCNGTPSFATTGKVTATFLR